MGSKAEELLKAGYKRALALKHRRASSQLARRTLARLEDIKGRTDANIVRQAKHYAGDVLGWTGYAPWLRVYGAVAGEFREGWIPKTYYEAVVLPKLKGVYGPLSLIKSLNHTIFEEAAFPDLAKLVNGLFYTASGQVLHEADVEAFVFDQTDRIIFKADGVGLGLGVSVIDRRDFHIGKIRGLGSGVLQSYIDQHESLAEFESSSVATLRVTTVTEPDGKASPRSCYLRLGRDGYSHVTSDQQVRVPLDLETGALDETGYLPDWQAVTRHPDTNVPFADFKMPEFAACVSTALRLHNRFPYACCIGWDLTVDRNNEVKVMEWNGNRNDIKFSEAVHGPCFQGLGWENLWR